MLTNLGLTDIRRKQLVIVDDNYFLAIGNASIIDMSGANNGDEACWAKSTSLWEIADGDSVFKAGTALVVAEIIQCGLQAYSKDASEAITAAHQVFAGSHINDTLRYV